MAYTARSKVRSPGGLHPAYEAYGQNAAAAILSRVAQVPKKHQKKVLQKILGTIDGSLWSRTQTIAKRYQAQGQPPATALHNGLARAMSTGIVAELVKIGQTGGRPKRTGQVGLGCYGRAGMGDATAVMATPFQAVQLSTTPVEGSCSADGQFIFTNNAWQRLQPGQTCTPSLAPGPTTVVHTGTPPPSDTYPLLGADDPGVGPWMQVGSFKIPLGASQFTIHWTGALPADWATAIAQAISNSPDTDSTQGHPYGRFADFLGSAMPSSMNSSYAVKPTIKTTVNGNSIAIPTAPGDGPADFGVPAGGTPFTTTVDYADFTPVVSTTNPNTNEDWGVYMRLAAKDPTKKWDSTTNPYVLNLEWRKIDRHWYDQVWNFITHIPAYIIDAVKDAVDEVGSLACDLLTGTAGQAGAVVGGAAIGVAAGGAKGAQAGAAAGAAGAAVANKECTSPPPPPTVVSGSSWLLPVALFGGGALLLLALRKKKATSP